MENNETVFWLCKCGEEIEKPDTSVYYEIVCPSCKRKGCVFKLVNENTD